MFTGIIEHVGSISSIERADEHVRLTVHAPEWLLEDVRLGDSLSVNGVCLTVVDLTPTDASFDVVYETMRKTSLRHLAENDPVNLERAMRADGRFGGHIVQGHVDATGSIASIRDYDNSYLVYVDVPRELMRYIVRKGSICLDGISLTVVDAEDRTLSVAIIPHTWENTNLSSKRAGDPINIETDVIAKYVERMTQGHMPAPGPVLVGGGDDYDEPSGYRPRQYENSQRSTMVQATG